MQQRPPRQRLSSNEGIETELIELSGAKIHGCLTCRKCSQNKTAAARKRATSATI